MVLGLALIGWDRKMGPTFDFKYPEAFNLDADQVNKIYMSHAFKQDNFDKKEQIEISLDDQIILSYCDKSKVADVGYEMMVLVLHQKQKVNIDSIRAAHFDFAESLIALPKIERTDYILVNLERFFKKSTEKKIIVLGRPGTGKTSIKKVIFEGTSPKDLIKNPLEPTRGITPTVYSWLDLKLGLFDTSGQELDDLLSNEYEQALAFENTDLALYLMDFPMWVVQQERTLNDIKQISEILKKKASDANFIIFLHKIDLIDNAIREETLLEIQKTIKDSLDLPIYFTSLYPELIYHTYDAFHKVLSGFSKETEVLKGLLDKNLKDCSKTMFFVTNRNKSIIAQSVSHDFNFDIINHIHKLTAQLSQTFEEMSINDDIDNLVLLSKKKFFILMKNCNLSEFDLSNIVCASETLTLEDMAIRSDIIRLTYTNYFYQLEKKGS